ncbi:SPARC [Galendromus occidentalis]|uniref:SPARC n=1 Tax=Galendromus occidentalis TaxID=34638 RepID=A0AAJ7SDB0_9ACAR|nr:SPARC [Galendromus occidentalis]
MMVPAQNLAILVLLSCTLHGECAQNAETAHNTLKEKKFKHPCDGLVCDAGTQCIVNADRSAACECVKECKPETDDRRKVCSNYNVTFDSLCHLHQMACWCRQSAEGCIDEEYEHSHVDYFGTCRDIPKCSSEEMSDFPRRMREWLFNIMKDLAKKKALNANYEKLERQAEQNHGRQWVNAVIWKYCDLDKEPTNRVTLQEWGTCLGLEVDEIQDKCQSMHNGRDF